MKEISSMNNTRITIYKKNLMLINNEKIKKDVTEEVNRLLPQIVKEFTDDILIAEQIRIRTSKLTPHAKKYISNIKKEDIEISYSDIAVNIINNYVQQNETNIEGKIKNIIEKESATQLFYLKETLNQLDSFLLSLKEANNL